MQSELHIRLLGGFQAHSSLPGVTGSALVTTLNTPRLQSLLAYLLLYRDTPQMRQHIAFLFWPDSAEDQAQTNLRKLLVHLRQSLPDVDKYVALDRRTLQWRVNSPYTLDVSDFERAISSLDETHLHSDDGAVEQISRLRAAVDLYMGDLLPGCYDEWIAAPRERLRQGFLEALQRLVRALQDSGEAGSAILYAGRLLRYDPLQEENYRRLMQLYIANGDGAAAIAVYRQCVSFLRRELGVEPSPATYEIIRPVEEAVGHAAASRRQKAEGLNAKQNRRMSLTPDAQHLDNNLPAPTTLFIGRERDVSAVSDLLRRDGVRLVTLTGTAGTGKTRLALQTASGLASLRTPHSALPTSTGHPFPDGIFFVPLASIDDPGLIPSVIARTLGVAESGNRPVAETLLEYLRDRSLLLVLDNFEHLLPAASLVSDLLGECPRLKVLVTSRATLNLRGEHEYLLPPMQVPDKDLLATITLLPEDLMQYEAVALFVERALEVSPGFALSRSNARSVAEICRVLEGLPLAIELAAARVRVLSPGAILSRLDSRLKLLVGGRLDLPPRQRTLETAIAWSYNLLDPTEQALFRKLSIFSGGFTLEAAEGVTGGTDLLDVLSALVSKSLLAMLDAGPTEKPQRFFMLETIREYALEKLRIRGTPSTGAGGEEDALAAAHALYFVGFAESVEPHLVGPDMAQWMDRLEDERDNFRIALRWAKKVSLNNQDVEQQGSEIWLRLVGALWRFWKLRGDAGDGEEIIDHARAIARKPVFSTGRHKLQMAKYSEQTGPAAVRVPQSSHSEAAGSASRGEGKFNLSQAYLAKGLYGAGILAYKVDDFHSARTLYEESLTIRREIGDKKGIGDSLNSLATTVKAQGDYPYAHTLYEEALAIRRQIEDKEGIGQTLQGQGYMTYIIGDYGRARLLLERSLEVGREIGDTWIIAWAVYHLGLVAQAQGDYENARALFEQYLVIGREIGHRGGVAQTIGNLAGIAASQGDYASARKLYRQSLLGRVEQGEKFGAACCLVGLAELDISKATITDSQSIYDVEEAQVLCRNGARLLGAAEALLDAMDAPLNGDDRLVYARAQVGGSKLLGQVDFATAKAEGRAMTMQEAIALATGAANN